MKARLGIAPIAWWNDDLAELSDDVSLEEMPETGVRGWLHRNGNRPSVSYGYDGAWTNPARYGISVSGGWFSGLPFDGDIEVEKDRTAQQMEFFIAAQAPCIVYGETARSIQGIRTAPLATKPKLSEAEMASYGRKVSDFADWCAKQGMPISYHHHMAAAVETESELDLLMKHSSVPLLFDAGHMAFAGGDVLRVVENHHSRITHVHTKDIRRDVVDGLDRTKESFLDAVIEGAFTVPGDGSLDFEKIVKALAAKGYEGWFVVEAEQDPVKNPPLEMARKGHKELLRVMDAAGYEVTK